VNKTIIVGAGPAGLSAGYRLSKNRNIVEIFEGDSQVGGISKTVEYKGYYFDLGGHRFFTKMEDVNDLWNEILGQDFRKTPRLSRIYYRNKYFNYPITPANALFGVGMLQTFLIISSYVWIKIFPYKNEDTFEEWVSNRFGKKLYSIFFRTYTEKVWGIPCSTILAEWSAQRIKGLSLVSTIKNAFFKKNRSKIKTLIDQFDYPTYGPGMMYTAMKDKIEAMGNKVHVNARVTAVNVEGDAVKSIEVSRQSGEKSVVHGDNFISSMPLTELVKIMNPCSNKEVLEAVNKLSYRSIITVDIIVNQKHLFPDNWIYIHSPEVKLGRIQNFKNWSKDMVPDQEKTSLGLEYFCTENDELWNMSDQELFKLASREVEKIRICRSTDIIDYCIVKVPKAYPVYDLNYKEHMDLIEKHVRKIKNLQLVGRYGLFKYNNMDHSIATGLYAAKNIEAGAYIHDTWSVNTDEEYHEEHAQPLAENKEAVPVQ